MPLYMLSEDEFGELYAGLLTAQFVLTHVTRVFDIFGTSTIALNYDIVAGSTTFKVKSCATLFRLFTLKCQELAIIPAYPELLTYEKAAEHFALVKEYFDLAMHYMIRSYKCVSLLYTLLTEDYGNQADKFALKSQYKEKFVGAFKSGGRLLANLVKQRGAQDEQPSEPATFALIRGEYNMVCRDIQMLEHFKKHDSDMISALGELPEAESIVYTYFATELYRRKRLLYTIDGGGLTFLYMFRDTLKILVARMEAAINLDRDISAEKDIAEKTTMTERHNELCQQIGEDWLVILELKLTVENHLNAFQLQTEASVVKTPE